ncbi:MAG: hypothetical protein PHR92_15810 [Lachnospiraceae bacterium]|nr:hypothetical protein [Lachnospiraceae bacterium]
MERTRYECFENERIYLADPECFYTHGFEILASMRKQAEGVKK